MAKWVKEPDGEYGEERTVLGLIVCRAGDEREPAGQFLPCACCGYLLDMQCARCGMLVCITKGCRARQCLCREVLP